MSALRQVEHYWEVAEETDTCFYRCANAAQAATKKVEVDAQITEDRAINPGEPERRSWFRWLGFSEQDLPAATVMAGARSRARGRK